MELSKNAHNKTNSGGYSELFFSLLRYSLFGAFLNKLRDDETQEKIKSFRCSLFGAFSKAQYCNATIYSDLFRCSSFGAFSKYSYKKVLLSCIVSFDAPYLELSLNAIWRSNYASLFLFRYSFIGAFFKVRSWKESIIRPLCFDAPYLELSLNTEDNNSEEGWDNCFDAPYSELSLNEKSSIRFTKKWICFDAPYLELSLNQKSLRIRFRT